MKKIYIAGPMSSGDLMVNVRNGIEVARKLRKAGINYFLPHTDILEHLVYPEPAEVWLKHDFDWIDACDALFRMPGYSSGASQEVNYAYRTDTPVHYDLDKVINIYATIRTVEGEVDDYAHIDWSKKVTVGCEEPGPMGDLPGPIVHMSKRMPTRFENPDNEADPSN